MRQMTHPGRLIFNSRGWACPGQAYGP